MPAVLGPPYIDTERTILQCLVAMAHVVMYVESIPVGVELGGRRSLSINWDRRKQSQIVGWYPCCLES